MLQPPSGAVPILDLIELRNPGAYLLFRAWWWLAPRGALPADSYDAASDEISVTVGELHHPTDPVESASPRWLSIPDRGLYTGICIVGAVGSGKTSACMHPFARQLLGWQADDSERRAAALAL